MALRIEKTATFDVINPDGSRARITLAGRPRWALECLAAAGEKGCTPIDTPGPRWAAYVFTLRHEFGVAVETVREKHGGPFPGRHGRYVLKATVSPCPAVAA